MFKILTILLGFLGNKKPEGNQSLLLILLLIIIGLLLFRHSTPPTIPPQIIPKEVKESEKKPAFAEFSARVLPPKVAINIPVEPKEEKDTSEFYIYQKPYHVNATFFWKKKNLKLNISMDTLRIFHKTFYKNGKFSGVFWNSEFIYMEGETKIDPTVLGLLKKDNFKWFIGTDLLRLKESAVVGVQYKFLQGSLYIRKGNIGLIGGIVF